MLVGGLLANKALTGEQRRHALSRLLVRLREQVRVRVEHGVRVVAQAGGDDVNGNALRERERGGGVAEDVQRPGGDAGREYPSLKRLTQGA